jgi:hypothetical protein
MNEQGAQFANLLLPTNLQVYNIPEMEPLVLPFAVTEGVGYFGSGGGNMLAKPRCFSKGKDLEPE